MGKKLAIKGHPTRGKEVIELLEMMGGKSNCNITGDNLGLCYLIDDESDIVRQSVGYIDYEDDGLNIFTLEEFLEKYPFKVGDLVDRSIDYVSCIIDDMRWNSEKCCVEYHLNYFNGGECGWHVSDCLIKPEKEDVIIGTKIESTGFMQVGKTFAVIFNDANYEDEVELQLGDYEIEVRDGKTYAIKKKPKYPTTFKGCRAIIDYKVSGVIGYKSLLLASLQNLLVCRDAYWKIIGDEMGLSKPWEPEWTSGKPFYCISVNGNTVTKGRWYIDNKILAFPTEEIRDTFYKNFKDLIENCKELL